MEITIEAVIGIIALGVGAFLFLKPKDKNKEIQKLEQQASVVKGKLEVVEEQRKDLKEKIEAEQKNATEEQKQEFWKDYVKKDDK